MDPRNLFNKYFVDGYPFALPESMVVRSWALEIFVALFSRLPLYPRKQRKFKSPGNLSPIRYWDLFKMRVIGCYRIIIMLMTPVYSLLKTQSVEYYVTV